MLNIPAACLSCGSPGPLRYQAGGRWECLTCGYDWPDDPVLAVALAHHLRVQEQARGHLTHEASLAAMERAWQQQHRAGLAERAARERREREALERQRRVQPTAAPYAGWPEHAPVEQQVAWAEQRHYDARKAARKAAQEAKRQAREAEIQRSRNREKQREREEERARIERHLVKLRQREALKRAEWKETGRLSDEWNYRRIAHVSDTFAVNFRETYADDAYYLEAIDPYTRRDGWEWDDVEDTATRTNERGWDGPGSDGTDWLPADPPRRRRHARTHSREAA